MCIYRRLRYKKHTQLHNYSMIVKCGNVFKNLLTFSCWFFHSIIFHNFRNVMGMKIFWECRKGNFSNFTVSRFEWNYLRHLHTCYVAVSILLFRVNILFNCDLRLDSLQWQHTVLCLCGMYEILAGVASFFINAHTLIILLFLTQILLTLLIVQENNLK